MNSEDIISAVIQRDLLKFKRNPVVIAVSVIMPLIYLVILGNAFQGKLTKLPMAVVDLDPGPSSRRLMENLRALETGAKTLTITTMKDQKEAIEAVREASRPDLKIELWTPSSNII